MQFVSPFAIPDPVTDDEMRLIFEAKCFDSGTHYADPLFERFLRHQRRCQGRKTFTMENSVLGPGAATILSNILLAHPSFRIINLHGNSIGNDGAAAIAELLVEHPSIISLDLSSNNISDEGACEIFRALRKNQTLVHLQIGSLTSVSRNFFGEQAVSELSTMLSQNRVLSRLEISMCEISPTTVGTIAAGLSANKTLQSLDISYNNIHSKGAALILSNVVDSNLRELKMGSNYLKDDLGVHMASFLETNESVRLIDLSGNQLSQRFLSAIALPISSVARIQELNLSKNPFGGRGITVLGPAIGANTTLRKLNISACKINPAGFGDFCSGLSKNTSLQVFICQHNPLRDDGATKLAGALADMPAIRELDLELCEIADAGARKLFAVVAKSHSLQKISIKTNLIRDGVCIQQALTDNPNVISLNIDYNDIEYKMFTEIQRQTAVNYRNWKTRREDQTFGEAAESSGLEAKLDETRQCISDQRGIIAQLSDQLAQTQAAYKAAEASRDEHLGNLEKKNEEVQDEVRALTDRIREENEEKRAQVSTLEVEYSAMSIRLAREVDQASALNKTLNRLDAEIRQAGVDHEEEQKELAMKRHETKLRYTDIKEMLIASHETRKEELKAEAAAIEAEKEAEKAAAKAASSKGKGKGKGKAKAPSSKGKAKGKGKGKSKPGTEPITVGGDESAAPAEPPSDAPPAPPGMELSIEPNSEFSIGSVRAEESVRE